jgi:hypothetical protein
MMSLSTLATSGSNLVPGIPFGSLLASTAEAIGSPAATIATVVLASGLMVATVLVRVTEGIRRRRMLEMVVRRLAEASGIESDPDASMGDAAGGMAASDRRRGGEWDTPVVPTVSTSPHRRDRRRSRRV